MTRGLANKRWKGNRRMQPSLFDHAEWLDYLKDHLLPRVLAQVRGQVLRIWSVGCQTGDEAAVLALALHALLGEQMAAWQIRIFATDSNPVAPARARQRVYPELPSGGRRWQDGPPLFECNPRGYRLAKALRNTIIFAPHDLLFQPPFPHLDLIVCHTPLALWALEKQTTVLNRFAYTLAAHQYLWLVAPDTVFPDPSYWLCLDADSQLYRRTPRTIPFQSLQWRQMPTLLESAASPEPIADLYTEELQVSLEEREVAYQELEQRIGELEQAYQELAQLNRLKDDFLSMASHELRTPLTTLLGYAQLLRHVLAQSSPAAGTSPALAARGRSPIELIDKMLAPGNLMATLIRDLLDVSRLHADVFALTERRACNVVDLVSGVVERQAAQTGRLISVESGPQALMVDLDEGRIEQVLTNLITNALKFSAAETRVTVSVQGDPPGKQAESALFAVCDHGCGISQEHQEHLFERFYRVRMQDNGAVEGLGLGLYIAAEIVKRHGGRIWVESARGVGSTFFVRLPLGKGA